MKKLLFAGIVGIMITGCSHHTYVANNSDSKNTGVALGYNRDKVADTSDRRVQVPATGGEVKYVNMLPDATAFRMSGNYSKNVAVTLSPDGELIYFPDPTDLTADSEPIELGEGWWLNTQGFGPNSVFTKYTFAEYASLPEVPSPQQIKLAIIPGAHVTEFKELPMKLNEALNNPQSALEALK